MRAKYETPELDIYFFFGENINTANSDWGDNVINVSNPEWNDFT